MEAAARPGLTYATAAPRRKDIFVVLSRLWDFGAHSPIRKTPCLLVERSWTKRAIEDDTSLQTGTKERVVLANGGGVGGRRGGDGLCALARCHVGLQRLLQYRHALQKPGGFAARRSSLRKATGDRR
jgi:hypothetical protein